MQMRMLGSTGISVSALCFGGNVFGWTADQATSFALLDAFVAAGGNFIDTADVYSRWVPGHSGGESETIIGNWLAARPGMRAKVIIATKVGMDLGGEHKGLSPKWIAAAAADSLKRLQTDYIDLYQSHTDDATVPLQDTLAAYDTLIRAGKVRAIGASNYSAARLQQALETARSNKLPAYATLQPLYNLYDREVFEKDLEPLCLREGIAVINFYALAAGFLTGKYRNAQDADKSARGKGVTSKYLNDRGLKILAELDHVAAQTESSPGHVAIAWLLARPAVTAPIASATSLTQLQDLIAACALKLDPAQIAALDLASA